ncbi:sugar transferase [Dictyobacter kobayashii]|uniref:Multidrug MFS transporter n=1 Tax=Dictyobacter kobayashii TaxID=2014872 RepID=A0A402AEA1_9CHLR|nr:sugar transferase [Dictyobacter kobayashii]GCE17416.1 multidrug MFS transporter [Dictyobacter kobayashii]
MVVQSAPVRTISINTGYLRAKRALDLTFTLLIAPFVILVGIIVAICIKLNSEGPIFFRQKRIGQNGVEFEMLKFRSMYVNSDQMAHREKILQYMNGQKLNEDSSGKMAYKDVQDPRITKIGRFIRKTSLDEIPQFWNVLKGQMSLVGPRPPLPYEVELYTSHEWLRMAGKPGLTGTWQVYGRSRVTFQNMIEMDIEYLEHQSIWNDLKLIVLTVPVMVFSRGGA